MLPKDDFGVGSCNTTRNAVVDNADVRTDETLLFFMYTIEEVLPMLIESLS